MKIKFSAGKSKNAEILVIAMPMMDGDVDSADPTIGDLADAINHNIDCDAKYKCKIGQTLGFAAPEGSGYRKIVLVGLGSDAVKKPALRAVGAPAYAALKASGYTRADVIVGLDMASKIDAPQAAAIVADSINAASYSFDKYITDDRKDQARPTSINVICANPAAARAAYRPLQHVTAGEFLAADMGNEPPNVLFPHSAAAMIEKEIGSLPGVNVRVIGAKEMKAENMNAALAVGQGSANEPCMVVIEYDGTGGKTDGWPLALVGKGVTFDTGGISIKPSAGMEEMKMDMCGAAAVVGTMRALAGRKADTKVVAICGFVENMPDGKSYRPGDIIKTRSGKTVNIGNTDAEGRLVLCDALDYIQDKYKPGTVIDLATLTGAIVSALAHTYSGVFTPDDSLWRKLDKAGRKAGQPGWRMPLHEDFTKAVKGRVADLENSARMRWGGASTAAAFLQSFIKASTRWAHLDIAGTAIPASGIANGTGVRWLNKLISDHFENSVKAAPVPPASPKPGDPQP